MKVNLNTRITDFYGEVLPRAYFGFPSEGSTDLRYIVVTVLGTAFRDELNLALVEKKRRYKLAIKIMDAENEVDLVAEEVALIKKLVGKWTTPLVVGQVDCLLEGKSTGISAKKE